MEYGRPRVRKVGLEPTRPKAQEPKSCVSADFTTPASAPISLGVGAYRRAPAGADAGARRPGRTSGAPWGQELYAAPNSIRASVISITTNPPTRATGAQSQPTVKPSTMATTKATVQIAAV